MPLRRRAATGTGGSRSFWRSRMNARSASGNRSKMKFMIFSVKVARSVTAPSAMLTWAIACSFSTDFSSSPRGASRGPAAGTYWVTSTDFLITVGMLAAPGATSERNTSWVEASASSSPSPSTCHDPGCSRAPLTNVPFDECRSSTDQASPRRRTRAWRRLIVCSGMQMNWSDASASWRSRPITTSSCSGNSRGRTSRPPSSSRYALTPPSTGGAAYCSGAGSIAMSSSP